MELENVFFEMDTDCGIDSSISYDPNSFSHSLDDLLPAWEDSFFGLGNGGVDDQITDNCVNAESPSHESDSGMSSLGSPETVAIDVNEEKAFSDLIPLNQNGVFDDPVDADLFSYLTYSSSAIQITDSPPVVENPDSPTVSENGDVDDTLAEWSNEESNKNPVDLKMNIAPPVYSARRLRNSSRLFKKAATKNIPTKSSVPRSVSSSSDETTPNLPVIPKGRVVPIVKVVRLVNPVGSERLPSTKELVQAVEDKNRKNAEQAKINREKKKTYIKELEEEVESLKSENKTLKNATQSFDSEREALQQEIVYLQSVLANQSSLSSLLKNIPLVKSVKLSSTFVSRKRSTEHDHDYEIRCNKRKAPKLSGGVCLHVDKDNVSLEFCSNCAKMASRSGEED